MTDPRSGFLGILMLHTNFYRFPGDIGNPDTWSFPVRFSIVPGAVPSRVIHSVDPDLLERFIAKAEVLIQTGALGIATSCGFLSACQKEFTERISVPVFSSSLLLLPLIQATLPAGKKVGVLTFSEDALDARHFSGAGIEHRVPVQGLPVDGQFQRAVLYNEVANDSFAARQEEVLWAAGQLLQRHADIGAILCECTNFGPHTKSIQAYFSLPVYDIVDALTWFWSGLKARCL
jgi:hypothetical protein